MFNNLVMVSVLVIVWICSIPLIKIIHVVIEHHLRSTQCSFNV